MKSFDFSMILNIVAVTCSLLLYLYAFFPFTTKSARSVDPPRNLHEIDFDDGDFLQPQFNRVVFMVVDALRLDFVNNRNMPYVSEQLSSSNGCFLRVKVESPTVTLPRIKAITSGSVPQFIDVVFNLIQTETIKDSFLHEAVAANKRLVFYGDDTWLKLYPDLFVRSEGTTSFYVNDFSEVDENVTRNVNEELKNDDWDMMFLHYLGLDHIGHVLGPSSRLIIDKLLEMDRVVQKVHKATTKTLIIVTGDHGMKDSGGHGGATFSETNVPFIMLGHKCRNESMAQTDISASLSILMGLKIPKNSIGKVIKTFFANLPYRKILYALRYNAILLKAKSPNHADIFENATNMHYQFLKTNDTEFAKIAIDLYDDYCSSISTTLIKSSVRQNVSLLIVSCCLIILNFTSSLLALIKPQKSVFTKKLSFLITLTSIVTETTVDSIFVSFLLAAIAIMITLNNILAIFKYMRLKNSISTFLSVGLTVHALTLFSSSFVEEEHQFWYFFAGSFLFLYAYRDVKTSLITVMGLRFLRTINQTGDKWASSPDLSLWFLQPENALFLQLFLTASLILVFMCLKNHNSKLLTILNCIILALIFTLKNSSTRNVALGQIIWCLILTYFAVSIVKKIPLLNTWILICSLLLKPVNVIMIPACIGASFFVRHLKANGLILWHTLIGGVLFYCQGHSNSLASVNIAAGFIGLSEYNPLLVIFQTLSHTYAFVILSHFLLMQKVNSVKAWPLILTYRMYVLTIVCVATILFRHHLFVWTVFAPKLLIETTHFVVTLIEIVIYTLYKVVDNKFMCMHR